MRCFSNASLWGLRLGSSVLGPDITENQSSNDQTKKNSDDAIANVIEIGIGRISLENAVEKSEGDLKPGITDPFASRRDPPREGSGTGNNDNERCDRFHVRHQE